MLIDSLYNSISQNLLSMFGTNVNATEQESNTTEAKSTQKEVNNQTRSGDKVSISAEALALYEQQSKVAASEKQQSGNDFQGQCGGGSATGQNTNAISSQIQALQGQLASLMTQLSPEDTTTSGQIEQLRMQISILQSQLS